MAVVASETAASAASLPYHEPGIATILVQTALLLALNVVNAALDRVLYCGLLGQVLIGIAWGTPGAKWLSGNTQDTIVQLGYLGLLLLVYQGLSIPCLPQLPFMRRARQDSHDMQSIVCDMGDGRHDHQHAANIQPGGLHTSFQSLKANLLLSSAVALTGITVPIGLSYTLQGLLDASPVQAFAAGAALCSTSLGTTFTVLGSSGLSSSRLGVVLTSAAMMDDVVGLVMVQVISNLGGDSFSWITIVRPVLVSVAFAVIVPLACLFLVKPMTVRLNAYREAHPKARLNETFNKTQTVFAMHTLLLVGFVAGASYAGTSNLFAAYIAGASISWWDSEVPHAVRCADTAQPEQSEEQKSEAPTSSKKRPLKEEPLPKHSTDAVPSMNPTVAADQHVESTHHVQSQDDGDDTCGAAIYQRYYHEAVSKILQPLFFASIGFSIPITRMFRGSIVWRGIVYTVLMAFAKFVCSLWLVRFSISPDRGAVSRLLAKMKLPPAGHFWGKSDTVATPAQTETTSSTETWTAAPVGEPRSSPNPPKPFSLHPPLILGLAMCARGEIGFLISGVAESNGVFSSSDGGEDQPSDIFLVVTWAIVLCTVMGPLGVGLSVRRVKRLQDRKNKQQEGAGREVLGVWGVG